MDDYFYIDPQRNVYITWSDFVHELEVKSECSKYIMCHSPYDYFLNIVWSILNRLDITLLDSDFSQYEIEKLTGLEDPFKKVFVADRDLAGLNVETLFSIIKESIEFWSISLFISGTTGLPSQVRHNYESLCRMVREGDKYKNDIWGFCYNPTHIAGIQVFFQAFLNRNTIINLYGLRKEVVIKHIEEFEITHISATPTFFRMLLPIEKELHSIRRLTSGGEKYDKRTITNLLKSFPNAKLNNVYATTEFGSLFSGKDERFTINDQMQDKVKVVENELHVHDSLYGKSTGEFVGTGDLVEVISENPLTFSFVSRSTEMINVGGEKVNPLEVEELIRTIDGIVDARVYGKKNSVTGNLIVCDYVSNKEMSSREIRSFLSGSLQAFKVPRIYKRLESLEKTRTGKTKRV